MEILIVEQFIKAIEDANENILYNVESIDSGSVSLSLMGCKISTNAIEGILFVGKTGKSDDSHVTSAKIWADHS